MTNEEKVAKIRQKYPKGTVVKCLKMNDPYPVLPGTVGTVEFVDDAGQIHPRWASGGSLALVPGVDHFVIDGQETISVAIRPIEDDERKALEGTGLVLDHHVVVSVMDTEGHCSYIYLTEQEYQMYGYEYIRDHVSLEYVNTLEDWYVQLNINEYHNDPAKFPPKTIVVERYGRFDARSEEIYFCRDTKKYYIRLVSSGEKFARWMSAFRVNGCIEDGSEIRANVTFVCNGESETVTFNNWNGNAAYSNTFNPNFGKNKEE